MTKSIVSGFFGLVVLGLFLFTAPQLWSQRPEGQGGEPVGPPSPGQPGPPGGGFPGGPGGFPRDGQFPLDPVSAALDTNHDRELSAEEIARAAEVLATLDKNKDGKLTSDEAIPPFRFGGFGGRGGFGGPGGGPERKLLKEYDKDGNGYLTQDERADARKAAQAGATAGGGRGFGGPPGGPGGPGGRRGGEPPKPGEKLSPADVSNFPEDDLYDTEVLRTVFITFENSDWETELSDFHNTDVEVPATLVVDGEEYPGVGVHFRGMSSYMGVGPGWKRSFNLAMDLVDSKQRLYGYKTLNLLNSNGDPSMMSSVLYSHIARQFIPAPKANFVKVVINGESWGVYVNVEQFNKDFLKENYPSTKGARWKVRGNPGADGGLRYVGEEIAAYRSRYQIKSADDDQSWKDLIHLCRVIDQTPAEQLEAALDLILDVDGVLRFLALDCALVNSDGYWTRSSDYSLYQDESGKFHVIPHDMNEAFHGGGPPGFGPPGGGLGGPEGRGREREGRDGQRPAAERPPHDENGPPPPAGEGSPEEGPPRDGPPGFGPPGGGFGGPPGGGFGGPSGGPGGMMHGGVDLDPLIGLDDERKPLRSKLFAVPRLKAKYLSYVRQIAENSLDWKKIGPVVAQCRSLIEGDVAIDTRQLGSYEAFRSATDPEATGDGSHGLRHFFEARRAYLLANPAVTGAQTQAAAPTTIPPREPETLIIGLGAQLPKSSPLNANSPRVIINELMASNTRTLKNPQGKYADWIEIYNPTESALDLTGVYVTDTDRAPRKWQFTKGTVVPAGGYLILWADEDGKATDGIHLNFKLSSKGEDLYLVDSDERGNAVLDHIRFEKQTDDVAYGRDPQRSSEWVPLFATPGAKNRVSE